MRWIFIFMFALVPLYLFCEHTWIPKEYERHSTNQEISDFALLDQYPFMGSEKVLDLGCGTGRVSAYMADKLSKGSVVGVDVSESMVSFAKNNFEKESDNLNFYVKDAVNLEYDNEFDLVFSLTSLHWINDQYAVLKNIKNSLKPLGRAVIHMPTLPDPFNEALKNTISIDKWQSFFINYYPKWRFYYPQEYKNLLEDAGLQPIKVELVKHHDVFEDKEAFKSYLHQWLPYLDQLPEEKRGEFLEDLAQNYLNKSPLDAKGNLHFSLEVLEVEALNSSNI